MPPTPPLTPTHDQVPTLYVIVVYTVVIFALWNIPGARVLINPLKLFTIGWHELCHITAAIFTGGTIVRVCIDPDLGGATIVEGGAPTLVLSAGYIGSTMFGGVLILAGFDTLVAKIMSFIIGIGLLCPLVLVRDKLTIITTLMYEGLLVGFWFIDHAQALRWYCLFLGVMNTLYVIWDIADDKYFRKANDSDATQFSLLYPSLGPHVWGLLWIIFEIAILTGFVLLGVVCFKMDSDQMRAQAAEFLPT
ncbi:uncharacterized protein PHACADRAFT_264473 [Phanerochaete carnosa HHB-10118-sp]|uniref:Peptidase M50B-like-domain-containing protein n=1 Tax=Phanerochaete carnosa (strain HHB-10118-sp) TaxID=650164 RepID=K5VTV5_PHACS|nr:uncharacterized protein PHACADRAFT_264473 [Phanerochaete carnosa HHB-10118-sp]EKM49999.1 hypothetical protein PHACADRAFT_264473 [Phanerochaete carnosa HHB-10118-sp]